jgi:hypothetical protein
MGFERVQLEKGIRLLARTGRRSRTNRPGSSEGEFLRVSRKTPLRVLPRRAAVPIGFSIRRIRETMAGRLWSFRGGLADSTQEPPFLRPESFTAPPYGLRLVGLHVLRFANASPNGLTWHSIPLARCACHRRSIFVVVRVVQFRQRPQWRACCPIRHLPWEQRSHGVHHQHLDHARQRIEPAPALEHEIVGDHLESTDRRRQHGLLG